MNKLGLTPLRHCSSSGSTADATSTPIQRVVMALHDAIEAGAVTAATYDTFVDGLCLLHGHERAMVEWGFHVTYHLTPAQKLLVCQGQ
jgi:hypothetical protein